MLHSMDIVIPVLNEAPTLEVQVTKLLHYVESHSEFTFEYRVTIADNGSTDSTLEIADNLARHSQKVRVVSVGRRGVGLALKEAWGTSAGEYIGYMDLDFSTDLKHLLDVEEKLRNGFDAVFGSRLLPTSVVLGRSLKRELTSKIFNRLIQVVFRSSLSDGMCGFKFFRRELLSDFSRIGADCDGWFYCTEITVAAQLAGSRIYELPISWHDDSASKVRIPSLTMEYLRDIRAFKRRIRTSRRTTA